jgi:rRNA-processing protein EBP2
VYARFFVLSDHMAKVKDRLIFETKKIEAVAQRKSNKEQKLRAKESHSNKLAEKAKRKRDHFQAVDEWAQSAASKRGRTLNDDEDGGYLNAMSGSSGKKLPNKKRMVANKKFGFGGRRGLFKQNDSKTLNDTSSFNPRGNFAGGMKHTAKSASAGGGSGSGAKRKGKRARDAGRSKR